MASSGFEGAGLSDSTFSRAALRKAGAEQGRCRGPRLPCTGAAAFVSGANASAVFASCALLMLRTAGALAGRTAGALAGRDRTPGREGTADPGREGAAEAERRLGAELGRESRAAAP